MSDWRKQIDDELAEKQRAKDLEDEQKKQRLRDQANEKYRNVMSLKKWWLSLFKCHICKTPAKEPQTITLSPEVLSNMDGSLIRSAETKPNYLYPGDLEQCSKCWKWTCKEHIYKGVCQKCA